VNRSVPEAGNATSNSNTSTEANAPASGIWMLISALLMISNFVTGYLLWRRIQAPQTADSHTETSPTETQQWRLLRKACQQQTPADIRQALLQWASTLALVNGNSQSQITLTTLSEHIAADDLKLAALLDRLDQSLFDTSGHHHFAPEDGQSLLTLLEPWRKANTSQSALFNASNALPDLYGATR